MLLCAAVVAVPDKKRDSSKKTPSNKMRVLMLLLIFILVISYVTVLIIPQNNYIAPPSPSLFEPKPWMSSIPTDIEGFRFLNITQLVSYPNLFTNSVLLSIPELSLNISVYDAIYGLDMLTKNNMTVNIIAMNKSESDRIALVFSEGNLTTAVHNNVTIYRLSSAPITQQGEAWICIHNETIILSEGANLALASIESVLDAPSNPFFGNDSFKVGYLMASLGNGQFLFWYTTSGDNTLNVDWEMWSAANSSGIALRYLLHFPVSGDVGLKYQDAVKSVLSKAITVSKSDNAIIGDFSYASSDIRAVVMGLIK